MSLSISEFIKIDPDVFAAAGAFDAILDIDSKFYVDPLLLRANDAPELKEAYDKAQTLFAGIIRILSHSNGVGDAFWREAYRLFDFPEARGLCIGYSASSTFGSGWGPSLRRKALTTAKEIVDGGVQDPAIFELVGILEEGIGADRISDMLVRIIFPDLLKYSDRVFTQLGTKIRRANVKNTPYHLPINPYSNSFVVLVPRSVLRPLPVANSLDEIDAVCEFNRKLRQQINWIIGTSGSVRQVATTIKKNALRQTLIHDAKACSEFIEAYKAGQPPQYDFDEDSLGEVSWYRTTRKSVQDHPLGLPAVHQTLDDMLSTVRIICNKYKDLIENNGLSSLLYKEEDKPKHEEAAQKLFYGIASSYCEANNIDISAEVNSGRGPVDFKLSRGCSDKVVVEVKLTTNSRLKHGYETQLPEYQKAEKSRRAVFLVIDVGGHSYQLAEIRSLIGGANSRGIVVPEMIYVDGRKKLSASKYKAA